MGSNQIRIAQTVGVLAAVFVFVVLLDCVGQWQFKDQCNAPDSDSQALFDYVTFYYCSQVFPSYVKALGLVLWLLVVISLLASTADNFFVPTLEKLSEDLGLSEEVAGVTLLALGNGMPDLMTATSSVTDGDFSLVMGDIFGAAMFILAMVLGAVLLCSPGSTEVEPRTFTLNAAGYIIAISLIFAVSYDSSISLMESIAFFIYYGIYVVLVVLLGKYLRAQGLVSVVCSTISNIRSTVSNTHEQAGPGAMENGLHSALAPPVPSLPREDACNKKIEEDDDEDILTGLNTSDIEGPLGWLQYIVELPFSILRHLSIPAAHWSSQRRALSMVCPLYAVLICALGFGGTWDSVTANFVSFPVYMWAFGAGVLGATFVVLASSADRMPRWHTLLLALSLLSTIAWFNIFANECVAILETFGLIFNISSSTLGITVLAWGNCVGDLVADTALARQGKTKMAVAGIFGSLIFSDCLGLGVAMTAYTATDGPLAASLSFNNKFAAVFLLCSVVSTVVFFAVNRFSCPRWFSTVLIAEYVAFMIVSVALEIKK